MSKATFAKLTLTLLMLASAAGIAGTPHDLDTLKSTGEYMRTLTEPGVSTVIDLSDPVQKQFVYARLVNAGKTAENSPGLYQRLVQREMDQKVSAKESLSSIQRSSDHFISGVASSNAQTHSSSVTSSYAETSNSDSTFYTYVDLSFYDRNGNFLDTQFVEEFSNGIRVEAEINNVNYDTQAFAYSMTLDSLKMEDSESGFETLYLYEEHQDSHELSHTLSGITELTRIESPILKTCLSGVSERVEDCTTTAEIYAPRDTNGDGKIQILLNREGNLTYNDGYDYSVTGNDLAIPLKGIISFGNDIITSESNKIRVSVTCKLCTSGIDACKQGGGCSKIINFSDPEITINGNEVEWCFDPLYFEDCIEGSKLYYPDVQLSMIFFVKLIENGTNTCKAIHWNNGTSGLTLQKLQLLQGCLAEGTQIMMADGNTQSIELIKWDSRLMCHEETETPSVVDIMSGMETNTEMVHLYSELSDVMMTKDHPVLTTEGMVQAGSIKQGDLVETIQGPMKITEVKLENYTGKVYNLLIRTKSEQPVMIANGFMVGDFYMQNQVKVDIRNSPEQVYARLPTSWHVDYANYLKKAQ